MAQFDVHKNRRGGDYPLVLDVQHELLSRLSTRLVVPMTRLERYRVKPISRLNPTVRIAGVAYVLLFQELAAVPESALGPRVTTLSSRRGDLLTALDLLITGI